jgi:hypothetical protein
MQSLSQTLPPEVEAKIKEMSKPGVVFSEPFQAGKYIVITASRYEISKDEVEARPVGAILIGEKRVKVHYLRRSLVSGWTVALVTSILLCSSIVLHPPWKPEVSLLDQVSELMKTIRKQ